MAEEKAKPEAEVMTKKAKAPKKVVEEKIKITPKFEVQVAPNHLYRWCLINDGKTLVTSKTFPVKEDAFAAIRIVKECAPSKSAIERRTEAGKHFFRVKTSSHQVVATSAAFEKAEDLEVAILAAKKSPQAVVIDRTI